ncbi:protein PLASTID TRANSCRIPTIONALLY ACTIVE 16, chloroplastic-like [Phragmites australis]|uniref:protein PLASTID TRANSCRIPTIONALLY ACTIVE 16, chloroplastic-like n=1 Tax=Phragmites australis TaxID=29695 RepID=UPI002D7702DB|nr:protein PLASTID TRANSCRIPTIONALLY ACTIVE 16, chloroplastic-like [Phragmites australis]
MAPALTSNPPSFRPLSSPLRRRAATILCRVGAGGKPGKDSGADDDAKKRPGLFVDFSKLTDAKSLIPAFPSQAAGSIFADGRGRKDPQTVFVAGATGQGGVRIAQTLLRQGFAVRAGVPDLASAQELARLAAAYRLISPAEARRLNAVESDFDDPETIAKAIGPAAKVVVTVSPAEKGPEGGGVTTDDALRVVQAADLASVAHVVVVYDEGVSGLGGDASTYNVLEGLTSFFSNLFSRVQTLPLREFLAKMAETDVRYTLVKTSLTDDYSPESSYALVLVKEGASPSTTSTTDTGKVSKSQIAALVADVFSNVAVAENKVVEVSTSSSATSKPVAEAFTAIPEDSRRREYQEGAAKAKAEEEALASQRAEEAASNPQAKRQMAPSEEAAANVANEAQASLENLLSRTKGLSADFSWEKLSTQLAEATTARTSTEKEPKAQIATVRGRAKAKKLAPQRAVVKLAAQKVQPKPKQSDPKPEVRPVFGGLFKQETVYVDDD